MRLMDGHSVISPDVLARYAGDAAREVAGVTGLVGRHDGVRVEGDVVELHLAVGWGVSIPDVGAEVQRRVVDYLARMADLRPSTVNVVIEEIGAA
jgi:uncharacterized alkaline shock family protein YloU